MNEEINIEESLWNYIDGNVDAAQRSFIEKMLVEHSRWRSTYDELLEVHVLIKNSLELDQPSLRFTQNIMEDIARYPITPATAQYINKGIIRAIGLFFLITISGLLAYGFSQVSWVESASTDYLGRRINDINFTGLFSGNYTTIFMMINVVLALMMLDMYLTRKKMRRKNMSA